MPGSPGGEPVSGTEGAVMVTATTTQKELEITQWDASGDTDISSYGSSKSGGFKRSVKGNRLATGTVQGKIMVDDIVSNLLDDGDEVALELYVDESDTQSPAKKTYLDVPNALISNLTFGVNADSGEASTFQFSFTSDGTYTWTHENA